MVIVLCECGGGVPGVEKLPPHYHYMAGLVTMPGGEKKWLPGVISGFSQDFEQREFLHFDVRFSRDELAEFIESVQRA